MVSDGGELRRRVRSGTPCLGAFCDLGSSVSAEIVGRSGYDFVVVDLEHGYGGRGDTVSQLQSVTASGSTPLVRVPSARSDAIGWALDMGAAGIVVPRVETVEEVRAAEAATRYAARRGAAPSARAASFGQDAAYRAEADDRRLLAIQIETAEALEAVDAIAAVEGVDVLFVGPADLGRTLGLTAGPDHPRLLAAAETIAAAAKRAGLAAGVYLDDPALIATYASFGYTMFGSGFESALLAAAAEQRVRAVRAIL